jgi:hypothetical protein
MAIATALYMRHNHTSQYRDATVYHCHHCGGGGGGGRGSEGKSRGEGVEEEEEKEKEKEKEEGGDKVGLSKL